MVCFGRPAKRRRPVPRYEKHVVHKDRYRRLSAEELREASDELAQMHAPRGFRRGIENIGQDVYARKYAAGFTHELNRSVARWLERCSPVARRARPRPRPCGAGVRGKG